MDKTLGATSVIDSTNVELLVSEMKKTISKEAFAEAEEKVTAANAAHRKKASEHKLQLAAAQALSAEEATRAGLAEDQLVAVTQSVLVRVNRVNSRRRLYGFVGVVIIFLASQVGAAVANLFSGTTALFVSALAILLASVVQFVRPLRARVLDPILQGKDWDTLNRHAFDFGLYAMDERVKYDDGRFSLPHQTMPRPTQQEAPPRDLLTVAGAPPDRDVKQ